MKSVLCMLVCAALLLSGCAVSVQTQEPETSGTAETKGVLTEAEPPVPSFAETEMQTEPVLFRETEEKPVSVSVPVSETAAEPVTVPVTETVTAVPDIRVCLPKFRGQNVQDAVFLLSEQGLAYTITEDYDVRHPKGTVSRVRFRGKVEEDCYRIHPDYPVELTVSLGGRPHSNVTAQDAQIIYLTFDDGPSPYTETVLDILEDYGIRATFFMVGQFVGYHPERAKAVYDAGHVIACHSETHDYRKLYVSAEAVLAEIASWEEKIEKAIGCVPEPKLFRFPGGSNMNLLDRNLFEEIYWTLHDDGFTCFDWTFANCDRLLYQKPENQSVDEYLKTSAVRTLDALAARPELPKIMLLHDTAKETVDMLPWLLEYLTAEGYTFGTLDTLDGDWLFAS